MSDELHQRILSKGATLFGWQNVAPGTYGAAVKELCRDGLLRESYRSGWETEGGRWDYTPYWKAQ